MKHSTVAIVAASIAAGGTAIGMGEAEHFRPVTDPVAVAGKVVEIGVLDRLADVSSTTVNLVSDPSVYVGQPPATEHLEHTHSRDSAESPRAEAEPAPKPESFQWLVAKLIETTGFYYGAAKFAGFALRRRRAALARAHAPADH